jgi:fermentation-respiration switch protein FrsA (DUF1100 family)
MFALCPEDVGIILTYRCHSGCKHCLYNCGPRWKNEAMSPETLRQALELSAFGTVEENPAFWASIDPNSYLTELSGPVQLHHGTADESVPVEYSEDLYARLQEIGWTSELYLYANDNHNISNSFGTAMQRSVQFFDQYVKGTNGE